MGLGHGALLWILGIPLPIIICWLCSGPEFVFTPVFIKPDVHAAAVH